jgi:hypothetical protein
MNHNFADWELTQLLPKINLYNDTKAIDCMGYEQLVAVCKSMLKPEQWRYLWHWEDIRLYLKERGYIISIFCHAFEQEDRIIDRYEVSIIGDELYDEYFDTYEEARYEAIKHCLTLINNANVEL